MVQCLFSKLRIIENGQFNHKGFVVTFSPAAKGNLKKLAALREIGSICQKEADSVEKPQGCNITKIVLDCFGKNKDKMTI